MSFETEELSGGTVRASVRSAADLQETQQATPNDPYKVHTGAVRDDGSGQLVQSNGQYATAPGSVLGTARSNLGPTSRIGGSDCSMELEPGNPASRAHFSVALRMGLIKETSPGVYADTVQAAPGAAAAQAVAQEEEAASVAPELAAEKVETDWSADIEALPQHAYDSAVALGVAAVASEGIEGFAKAAKVLSQEAGITPALAAQYVDAGYDFYEGQVATMAEGLGITADQREDYYSFMQDNHPRELQAAMQQMVATRRLDGFRTLATAYKARRGR